MGMAVPGAQLFPLSKSFNSTLRDFGSNLTMTRYTALLGSILAQPA